MSTKKKLILTVILLSYFVTAMDGAVIITGLEKIASELHLSQSALTWVQNAYVLSWGGFMLLGGKLSDTFGRRTVLNLSLVLFGAGSLVAGLARLGGLLIAARFLQGMGAAVLAPTSLALIIDYFHGMERIKAVAWYSSISGLGLSVGLVIGGILAGLLSWRYGFFINIPIVIFMLVISLKVLTKKKPERKENAHFDIVGTLLSITCVFTFVFAIDGADNPWIWLSFTLISALAFIHVERRTHRPVMPLRLFNAGRSRANFARLLFTGAMTGFYFFVSEYLQEASGLSPAWIGVSFLPLTLSTFVAAVQVPCFIRRFGNLKVLFAGQTLMVSGFVMMLYLGCHNNYWLNLALPMLVLGIGQGFTMSPLTNLGIAGASPEDNGSASGIVNAAHQIGCSVGLSVIVAATATVSDVVQVCHIAMCTGLLFTILSMSVIFIRKQYILKLKLWRP